MTDYKNHYEELRLLAEKNIEDYLQSLADVPEPVFSAIKYSVLGGGKRIRPVFALHGAELASGDVNHAKYISVAIELVHCYSLVHDDMPCMDNDVLRRGKPTTHVKYGEGMALLAGDGLLSLSFDALINNAEFAVNSSANIKSYKVFSDNIGATGMIAGQCVDIANNNAYSVEYLHSKKTSALLKAGLVSGAVAGGADGDLVRSLDDYAENFGMAFQITDDVLDVTGTVDAVGKTLGKDKEQGKRTFVESFGVEKSNLIAKEYVDKAICSLSNVRNNDFLTSFALSIIGRTK